MGGQAGSTLFHPTYSRRSPEDREANHGGCYLSTEHKKRGDSCVAEPSLDIGTVWTSRFRHPAANSSPDDVSSSGFDLGATLNMDCPIDRSLDSPNPPFASGFTFNRDSHDSDAFVCSRLAVKSDVTGARSMGILEPAEPPIPIGTVWQAPFRLARFQPAS